MSEKSPGATSEENAALNPLGVLSRDAAGGSVAGQSPGAPAGAISQGIQGSQGGPGSPISQGGPGGEAADSAARRAPPFPVATLIRRMRNAKSARDLHDIAFNGWEASIRLAVAVKPPPDVTVLFEPSTGSWATCVRAILTDGKLDDPHLRAVHALFSRVGASVNAAPMYVTPRMLFEYIASYRNNLHGHGAVRGSEFYESAGEILLNGLEAAWRHWIFLPDAGELVFVQSIETDTLGQRRARVYLLKGGEPMLESRVGSIGIPEGLRPRRVYLRVGKRYYSLHPWLLYDDKDDRERVLFYNGRNKYLDFITGETPRVDKLQDAYPTLLKELDALFRGKAATIFSDSIGFNPNDFGDYEIVCDLGQGGMSRVCLAKQKSLERRVALKMPLPGTVSDPAAMQRFAREIQVLSQCDHPNVVKILDSGIHNNTPFYVMEYIEGADLARIAREMGANGCIDEAISNASFKIRSERAERLQLSAPERSAKQPGIQTPRRSRQELLNNNMSRLAAMIRDAARGLHHLHQHGIVHRDIKPSNLMLTDGEHRVVVMDLGLAALADGQSSVARETNALLGTLRYMAPEQLQRQPVSLDRRADVYSLCATFYELLTGKPFLTGENEQQLLHQILYEEPLPIGQANPFVPRDIQLIVTKGCQKDPRQRYQTADELAMDLNRWIVGDPIAAREPSLAYLLSLSIRKHKALVLTAAACFAVMLGLAFFLVFMRQEMLEMKATEEKRAAQKAVLERAKEQLVYGAAMQNDGQFGKARDNYASARTNFEKVDYPATEANTHLDLLYLRHRPPVFKFEGHRQIGKQKGRIFSLSLSPVNENTAITAGDESGCGVIKIWDLRSGRNTLSHFTEPGDRILHARFSPDGTKVLFSGWLSKLNVWHLESGQIASFSGQQESIACLAFSKDGNYAVSGSYNGFIQIWDMARAELVNGQGTESSVVRAVTFSSDGTICAAGSSGKVSLWKFNPKLRQLEKLPVAAPPGMTVKPGEENVFTAHKGGVNGLAYIENGKRIVTCGDDRLVKIWNAADGTEIAQAYGHQSEVVAVSVFENDAHNYAVSACGTTLRIWDLEKISEPQTVECGWHESGISSIAVQGKGKRVLTAGADGSLMMWNLPFQKAVPFGVYESWVRSVKFSASGKLALVCGDDAGGEFTASLMDTESGLKLREFTALRTPLRAVAFSADERSALGIDADGRLMKWPLENASGIVSGSGKYSNPPARTIHVDKSKTQNLVAAFSPDGRWAAIAVSDFALDIVEIAQLDRDDKTPESVRETLTADDKAKITSASFSKDGAKLLTANMKGTLRLWNIGSKEKPVPLKSSGESPVFGLALSEDGKRAVTGSFDFICRLWDIETRTELHTFEGHTNSVFTVAYSPKTGQIATGGIDQSIRIWDANDGRLLYTLNGLKGSVFSLDYSRDGQALMYGCRNGRIEVLDFKLAANIRRLQEKIATAQNNSKADDDDPNSLAAMSEWLAIQGAWGGAADHLEKLKNLSPATFDGYALLGRCNWVQAINADTPESKGKFMKNAFDAYQTERQRVWGRTPSAGQDEELLRLDLILNAISAQAIIGAAPDAKVKFLKSAFEAFRLQRERVQSGPSSVRQDVELKRLDLILSVVDAELRRLAIGAN